MIAALYVQTGGAYFGLEDVDPWDEQRDARLYAGPWAVVAHPPCARWSTLAYINQSMHGYQVGDDGGCFAAALSAVRRFGGVLEHPAGSLAWKRYALPAPTRGGWTQAMNDPGCTTEVSQVAYGHRARKRTWLYFTGGGEPPALDWRDGEGECIVSDLWQSGARAGRGSRCRQGFALPAGVRARGCTKPKHSPPRLPSAMPCWIWRDRRFRPSTCSRRSRDRLPSCTSCGCILARVPDKTIDPERCGFCLAHLDVDPPKERS